MKKNPYHLLTEDEKILSEASELIRKAEHYWSALHHFREERTRNRKFVFGDQWSDTMQDPDSDDGSMITEKEYLIRQGRFPAINNQMGTMLRNLVGQYRQNKPETIIQSRQRDKQKSAEMLTSALKHVLDLNRITAVDASELREFIISGACGWKVTFDWWHNLNTFEVKTDPLDQTRVIHNPATDPRMTDINFFGYLHDLSLHQLISLYAVNKSDAKKIKERYDRGREHDYDESSSDPTHEADYRDFYMESDLSKFRVVEIWTHKYEWMEVLHDPKTGTMEEYNGDEDELNLLIQQRTLEAEYLGIDPEDYIPTVERKYDARYWCYHLTPYGDVLFAAPTPFWHQNHPFELMKYPLVDGVVRPLMSDIIDQQKHINRNISIIDFMISVGAKGVLLVPKNSLGKMSPDEFAKKWRSFDDVIVFEPKHGEPLPKQISANAMPTGVTEMLNTQLQLMDKISGLNGAMQGQAPSSSSTPASLYAQQTMNASLNNRDIFDVFNEAIKQRNKKIAQTIQQYWQEPKFLRVKSYARYEEVDYDPQEVVDFDFDTVMNETVSSALYRSMMDDMLQQWVMNGLIQLEDMLEMSSMPFADTLLEKIRARQEEMQDQQQIIQDPNQLQQV